MKKLIFLLLAATLYSSDMYAIGYYSWNDTLNVFALSGLRLRDKPGGAVIATAPYGSKITMQEQQPSDRRDTIENIPGHWAKAVWQGKEGYVFDGFLSRLPAPDADLNTLEAYCDRFFRLREEPPVSDVEAEDHIEIQRYRYQNWHIVLEHSESADEAEAYGYEDIMTIKSGNGISPEEIYLLMRALFRDEIAKCLEKIKTRAIIPVSFIKRRTQIISGLSGAQNRAPMNFPENFTCFWITACAFTGLTSVLAQPIEEFKKSLPYLWVFSLPSPLEMKKRTPRHSLRKCRNLVF